MKTIKSLERLQQLHLSIKTGCTGNPRELSKKLGISERLLYLLIEQLKSLEASICYDRTSQTYYYQEPFQLNISISVSAGNNTEKTELFQGSYLEK